MPTSGKNMVKAMRKHGWKIDRIEGSHFIMKKNSETIVVPVHRNKDLKSGTEARIRKITGLRK